MNVFFVLFLLFLPWLGCAQGKMPRLTEILSPAVETDGPTLKTSQDAYFHDAFVEWTLSVPPGSTLFDKLSSSTAPWVTWVEKDGAPVTTIGMMREAPLVFSTGTRSWSARWPVPWNAPDGTYAVRLDTAAWPAGEKTPAFPTFKIQSREFKPVPKGFGVLTLEGHAPFHVFRAPDGQKRASAMAEWAEFMGADALVVQGAETSGFTVKLSTSFPWLTRNEKGVIELGKACRERGLKLGVYVLSFMVGGPPQYSPDYQYGWYYENGRPVYGLDRPTRRGISILDPRRPHDIVKMLNRWAAVPGVDFVGLDYIRPVFGGNELVEDFVREMPGVTPPARYAHMTKVERMKWIAPGRYVAPLLKTKDPARWKLSDQWFWYRAHCSARVVRQIAQEYAGKTPLWGFTLSWQKGWEHAQDPVMFRDAGLDIDAIMLYEATGEQFRNLVGHWGNYALRDQLNLVVGDTYDWRLHQKTTNPAGPEDFYNRMMMAVTGFHKDKPVRGIFTHDLNRALSGPRQLGPYTSREWFLAGGAAMTRVRELNGALPYDLTLTAPDDARAGATLSAVIAFGERPSTAPVRVEFFSGPDLEVSPGAVDLSPRKSSATLVLRWRPNDHSVARGRRTFLAARAVRPDFDHERAQIHMKYVQGAAKPVPAETSETPPATPPAPPAKKK